MNRSDPFAELDARLASFLEARADAAAAAAPPLDAMVARLERRVGGGRRRSSRIALAPSPSNGSWVWVAVAAAALVALLAGALLVGSRPHLAVAPEPSGSHAPSVATGPFSLGLRGSIVVARLSAGRLTVVSVAPSGAEQIVGAIDRFTQRLGDGIIDDGSLDPGCWRFCLPSVRVSATGLLDISIRRGAGGGVTYSNLVFDLTSPERAPVTLPAGVAMFEPDGTLVLETGDPLAGGAHILRYPSPTATPLDLTFPNGLSPAFSQWTPTGYALAADGSGVFASRANAKAPAGVEYLIVHWDGSTGPTVGVAPMFTTGSDRILGADGSSEPFSGLWDRAGDVSCGPTGGKEVSVASAVVHVFCAGADGQPSPRYPAADVPTGLPDTGGIVGFTDSAALVDLWDPSAASDSTTGGHETVQVPLDGSTATTIKGLLMTVVQDGP
jgi:hypothetical protein